MARKPRSPKRAGLGLSAPSDSFVCDHLPPPAEWPVIEDGGLAELRYPQRLNAAAELLDNMVEKGFGARPCLRDERGIWSYAEVLDKANRIAAVLVHELGLVPGERVLLRDANTPMMAACWLAVLKAGGIAVATMPLLRARELAYIIEKAKVKYALCAEELVEELARARSSASSLKHVALYHSDALDALEARMARQTGGFKTEATACDDVALIAFTSGTTGAAKGTVHFHRDILAVCDTFAKHVLRPTEDDIFCGSPPLAFTYGLGGLLLFPLRVGASSLLLPKVTAETLLEAMSRHRATVCFTAPTLYRAMTDLVPRHDIAALRKCVSAGETLPRTVFDAWLKATGIKIIDGIGATEMLHIFISASDEAIRPGATGKPVPGYRATVLDDQGMPLPPNSVGRLAVRGPTGCRYLDMPEQQRRYVQQGWNITGDAYLVDSDGYFWYQARTDDMIISAGYNIAGPEVEAVLLEHPKVRECAVIGAPDAERGQIVKAFVVLCDGVVGDQELCRELQEHVRAQIAPYKYPRAIDFVASLPRTETGKLQRFRLREMERVRGK
jgi:2-aminobenzoate-CoA ligase